MHERVAEAVDVGDLQAAVCSPGHSADGLGQGAWEDEDIRCLLGMDGIGDGAEELSQAAARMAGSPGVYEGLLSWGMEQLRLGADAMANALVWLRVRRLRFSMSAVEIAEGFLRLSSSRMSSVLSVAEERSLVSVLQEIDRHVSEDVLGCSREAVCAFLLGAFTGRSKARDATKMFAFSLYMRANACIGHVEAGGVIGEMDGLGTFDVGGLGFRDHVVLSVYGHVSFRGGVVSRESHEYLVDVLFGRCVSCSPDGWSAVISAASHRTAWSRILCVSLGLRLLKGCEDGDDCDPDVARCLAERLAVLVKDGEWTGDESIYFSSVFGDTSPCVAVCKVVRSLILLLLQMAGRHGSRARAARALLKLRLSGVVLGRRMSWRILRIARKHIGGRHRAVMRGVVNVIGQLDMRVLVDEMQKAHPLATRREMFERVKDGGYVEECCRTYVDLLGSRETRDVEYRVPDVEAFARALCSHEDKSICRFAEIRIDAIGNVFVAELAAVYSGFHPDSVDEVYVASLLLTSGEEIVRGRNVAFYRWVLRVLVNVSVRVSPLLGRRLAVFLRRLVFYSPYTRDAGMLINALGHEGMEFPRRTDYFIAVLGACGSPWFRDRLPEYEWSPNKECGLVYSLRFDPSLVATYRWKLEEILWRARGDCGGREAMACAELLCFLRESVGLDASSKAHGLVFELVANNSESIVGGARSRDATVSKEACMLLREATRAGAVLPHVSIPVTFAWHSVSREMVRSHFPTVLSTIQEAVEGRVGMFKERKKVLDLRMVYDIYACVPDRPGLVGRVVEMLDECPVKTYYLMAQASRFERRDFGRVVQAVESMTHSYDPEQNRLLLRLHTVFGELCGARRGRGEVRISDEAILFAEAPAAADIDMVGLCVTR